MKKLLIVLALLLTGCASEDNKVTVLTSSGYEPYEMVDVDGSLTGFDIELMEMLAEKVGIEIEWQDVNFDGIVASLQSGQAEIAIAGMTPTPDRAVNVDFSSVYYNAEAGLTNYMLFKDAEISSLDDLSGLVVGAQLGTIQAEMISELADEYGFTVDLRNSNAQIIEEIKVGRIDCLVVEGLVADSIIGVNDFINKVELDYSLDSMYGSAIAFTKGSSYVDAFNEALEEMKEDGSLDALINKWF